MVGINVPIPVPMAFHSLRRLEALAVRRPPHARPGRRALLHPAQDHHHALADRHPRRRRVRHADDAVGGTRRRADARTVVPPPPPVIPAEHRESRDRAPERAPTPRAIPDRRAAAFAPALVRDDGNPPVALSGATLPEAGEGCPRPLPDPSPCARRAPIPPSLRGGLRGAPGGGVSYAVVPALTRSEARAYPNPRVGEPVTRRQPRVNDAAVRCRRS